MGWRDGSHDRLYINGKLLPGIARVNVVAGRDVQVSQSPGTDGPTLKDQGGKPADIDVELELWRSKLWDDFVTLMPEISPVQPGALKNPLAITHPVTDAHQIKQVYTESITTPPVQSAKMIVKIKFKQWFKEATKTQQGFKPGDSGGALGDPTIPTPDPKNLGASFP